MSQHPNVDFAHKFNTFCPNIDSYEWVSQDMEVPTKFPLFFNNKILTIFPYHGCGNDSLFVVNAITTFTLIGATINPTYKGNC